MSGTERLQLLLLLHGTARFSALPFALLLDGNGGWREAAAVRERDQDQAGATGLVSKLYSAVSIYCPLL